MRTTKHAALIASAALGSLLVGGSVRASAQQSESLRPNLSGQWTLNRELSEDAQAKLERLHSSSQGRGSQGGGHGPGRHGGAGSGSGQSAQMDEVRDLLLDAPSWFTVTQNGERIVLTANDGRVRTLTANGRKEQINGRDVRTRWDSDRLVSEISLSDAQITQSYERVTNAARLIVTTTMDMSGQIVAVRRVYDGNGPR